MAKLGRINWNYLASCIQLCKAMHDESSSDPQLMSVVTKYPNRTNYNIEFKARVDAKLVVWPKEEMVQK